jgi:hypothetical protein
MLASSVPALGLFAWWQKVKDRKDGSALVVPSLFKTKTFVTGLIVNLVFEGAMIGFFLPFTLLLQVGLGYEVVKAALTGIPTALGIALAIGLLGQKLIPKLGRYALTLGAVIMTAGLATTYLFVKAHGVDTSPWEFVPGLLITGAGMGLVMAPIFAVVLTDVDHKHAGSASGILNAVQQLGGAIGIAAIGLVFFGQLTSHADASFTSVEPSIRSQLAQAHLPEQAQDAIIKGVRTCFNDSAKQKDTSKTPDSCKQLESGPQTPASQTIATAVKDAAKKANTDNFISAFKAAMFYEGGLIAVTFILSFLLPRHIRPEAMEEAL